MNTIVYEEYQVFIDGEPIGQVYYHLDDLLVDMQNENRVFYVKKITKTETVIGVYNLDQKLPPAPAHINPAKVKFRVEDRTKKVRIMDVES